PSSRRGRRPSGVSKRPVGRRSPAAVSATGCMSGRPPRLSRSGRLIRTEVNRMASSPREALSTLPDPVLHDLAKAHGLDPTRYPNRTSLIEALASLADVESLLAEAERRRMEYHLERLRPRQLRELGERHRVSLLGLKRKSDLVAALATAPGSSEILLELEAQDAADREAGFVLGRDADVDYERVEELLEQARKRFQERQFEAALTAAQEASRIAERTTEQLRRASWSYAVLAAQGLLEPCDPEDPDTVKARALLDRARDVFFQGQTMDDAFLQDLVRAAEVAHAREADRVRELLALTRDSIREAANLGASIAMAEDAWKRGGDSLDRDQLSAARESFVEAGQRAEDARLRRIREVEESVGFVSDHIALARNVGADTEEAEQLLQSERNAEEAAQRLEAQVADERRRRGIQKPASGTCGVCRSTRVTFEDDGWGRCEDCGNTFRWRGPFGVWERLKAILIP